MLTVFQVQLSFLRAQFACNSVHGIPWQDYDAYLMAYDMARKNVCISAEATMVSEAMRVARNEAMAKHPMPRSQYTA